MIGAERSIREVASVSSNKSTTTTKIIDILSEKRNTTDFSPAINKSESNNSNSLTKNLLLVVNKELKNIIEKHTNLELLESQNISLGVYKTEIFPKINNINELNKLTQSNVQNIYVYEILKNLLHGRIRVGKMTRGQLLLLKK